VWLAGSWGLLRLMKKLMRLRPIRLTRFQGLNHKAVQGIFLAVLVVLLIGGLRGGYRNRPIQIKDIEKTQDAFLNKITPNFYKSLENTIKIYRNNSDASRLPNWIPQHDIRQAAENFFGRSCLHIDKCLERSAGGALLESKPQHIFLFIMESYDLWSFFPPYRELGLTANGQKLAQNGLFWTNFTSAGGGTMATVSSIISGVPQVGVQFVYQKNMQAAQPTSIAEIFKALGYKTKFYYGGYLSWQNVGRLVTSQGFDEVIGANTILPDFPFGDWGIPDKDLFNYVYQDVTQETEPTLHVILSLSYHRPFKIDIWKEGFVQPKLTAETQHLNDSSDALKVLGHFWYSDKVLGDFVRGAESKFENSLFIVTGDHWSRKGLTKEHSNIYQQNAVPLIMYGKNVLGNVMSSPALKNQLKGGELRTPGDSLDIVPTVVEMIAPEGFRYHTYGDNLLNLSNSGRTKKYFAAGGTSEVIVGDDFMFDSGNPNYIYARDGKSVESLGKDTDSQNLAHLIQLYFSRKAIAWWQVMRGNELAEN
jgi:phosphoglycerol transferase MdoB-like AlkP superfamily enzyme